jgi:colanic acid/amylovoran biosynthesis glycosyltransferase
MVEADLRVAFWRARLLPGSETFIRTQADALRESRSDIFTVGIAPIRSDLSRSEDMFPYRGYNASRLINRFWFDRTRRSRALERVIVDGRPQVIHAHFGTDAGLITPIARRLRVPMVVSVYGYDVTRDAPDTARGRRDVSRLQEAFDYASVITANSEFMRQAAIRRGADPSKVEVVHLGVKVQDVAPETSSEKRRSGVLFVGRFTDKKGPDDLVRAVALLPEKLRGTRVKMIGSGELASQVERLARELEVNVTFMGSQPHSVVQAELETAQVLAVPSRTAADGDSEGLPTIILEAAQSGVPIVSTRHSGIAEAVQDGRTGLLVGERDPAAFAEALERILSDPEYGRMLGKNGRQLVSEEFDSRLCARRLEDMYDRAIATAQ